MKITYKQFTKFEALMELGSDNVEATTIRMIEIFTGFTKEQVRNLPINELDNYLIKINSQLETKPTLVMSFFNEGIEYGLIPNFKKITTGELIDLDTLLGDRNFEAITNILYRPITKRTSLGYEIEPYKGELNRIKDLPYEIVIGVLDFFTKSFQHLKSLSHSSTEQTVKKKKRTKMKE